MAAGFRVRVGAQNVEAPEDWRDGVKALQRPSSSTLEAFLLPTDDPRVHRAREDLGATSRENRKTTDWYVSPMYLLKR